MTSDDTPLDPSIAPFPDPVPDPGEAAEAAAAQRRRWVALGIAIGVVAALGVVALVWQYQRSDSSVTSEPIDLAIATASLTVVQSATPNGGADFSYLSDGEEFVLDDPTDDDGDGVERRRQLAVEPGLVRIVQQSKDAWQLDSIACTDTVDEPFVDLTEREVVVQVGETDEVVCTFTNSTTDGRGVVEAGGVTVRVGADTNRDDRLGDDEPWLDGWAVRLVDADGTTVDEQTTNTEGRVEFSAEDGAYAVCAQMMQGWTNVAPTEADAEGDDVCVDVIVADGSTESFRFVNQPPNTNPDDASSAPSISADGTRIVFTSAATNLVDGDTNGVSDVFLFDTTDGSTRRISADGDGDSDRATISSDGSTVLFASAASNLVDGDTNDLVDVFVHVIDDGVTTRVNVAGDGTEANAAASPGGISADGTAVTFSSTASNLVDGAAEFEQVFKRDISATATSLISVNAAGSGGANGDSTESSISGDGTRIAFISAATDLVPDGSGQVTRNVYVRDTTTGITTHVSISAGRDQTDIRASDVMISADGNRVVYTSKSTNLVADDTEDIRDVFMFDAATGSTNRISIVDGVEADGTATAPMISADGTVIGYTSTATNLVDDDTNEADDVFVFDSVTGLTARVSVADDGTEARRSSGPGAMSADGTLVVFMSDAGNLVGDDTNRVADIFLRDTTADTTVRIGTAAH